MVDFPRTYTPAHTGHRMFHANMLKLKSDRYDALPSLWNTHSYPSRHMVFIQRRTTSWRCTDVNVTLYKRYLPTGMFPEWYKVKSGVRGLSKHSKSSIKTTRKRPLLRAAFAISKWFLSYCSIINIKTSPHISTFLVNLKDGLNTWIVL